MKKRYYIYMFVFIALISSCDKNRVFEKNIDFKTYEWQQDKKIDFEIDITDNDSKQLFVNFRHTYFFNTRNVRLKLNATAPDGKIESLDLNILLSEPNGMWHSECAGDFCDFKYLVNYSMTDTGKYLFSIEQDMRIDPLKEVLSIGLRVEKTETK